MPTYKDSPFPYFGGKGRAAKQVWERLGPVYTYIEPFAGTLAVLRRCPYGPRPREIANDKDGLLTNAWRSIMYEPEATAYHADWPTNHIDLIARKSQLLRACRTLERELKNDPHFCVPEYGGWWLWAISNSIDMSVAPANKEVAQALERGEFAGERLASQSRPYTAGRNPLGVSVQRLAQVSKTAPRITSERRPDIKDCKGGRGVTAQRMSGNAQKRESLHLWFNSLSERLQCVYFLAGDWLQAVASNTVMGITPSDPDRITGIFFDPPYAEGVDARKELYKEEGFDIAGAVQEWAIANGDNPQLRICIAGYEGDYADYPAGWTSAYWKRGAGMETSGESTLHHRRQEALWFSPHCLTEEKQLSLLQ